MKQVFWISLVLTVIGGINWGLVGTTGVDLVATIFGPYTIAARVIYGLVGFASILLIAISTGNVVVLSNEQKPTRAPRTRKRARAA